MLAFDETVVARRIATCITIGSYGTATDVTGDGAIAVVINKLIGPRAGSEGDTALPDDLEPAVASSAR